MLPHDDPFRKRFPDGNKPDAIYERDTYSLLFRWRNLYFNVQDEIIELIYDTYTDINTNMRGRSGLSLWDSYVIGCTLWKICRSFRNGNRFAYLETGTFHGASAILARRIMDHAERPKQTVVTIDPMLGFYGKELDHISEEPVNEEIFWENIERLDVSPTNIKLIVGSSYSDEVYNQVKDHAIHTFLVDGDHTYGGAKGDWTYYNGLIQPMGYVFFHDYRMRPVPEYAPNYKNMGAGGRDYGVRQFVDELVPTIENDWNIYKEATPANVFVIQRKP